MFKNEYLACLKERKGVDALERFNKHIRLHYKDIDIVNIAVKRLPDTYEWFREVHQVLMLHTDI
jgi:hypothetical protein